MDSLQLISALLELLISKYKKDSGEHTALDPEVMEKIREFLQGSSPLNTKPGNNQSIFQKESPKLPAQEHFGDFDFNFLEKQEMKNKPISNQGQKPILQKATPNTIKDLPNTFEDFNFDI